MDVEASIWPIHGDVVYAQTWYWPWKTVSPPSYARTAYVVAIWPSFLFDSFVKIWSACEIFLSKWFTAPPGKKFPVRLWFRAKKRYNSQAYCTLRSEMERKKNENLRNEKETGRWNAHTKPFSLPFQQPATQAKTSVPFFPFLPVPLPLLTSAMQATVYWRITNFKAEKASDWPLFSIRGPSNKDNANFP